MLPFCLSYDWQVGSIPLVESVLDTRNLNTLVMFVLLVALVMRIALAEQNVSVNFSTRFRVSKIARSL